MQPIKELPCGHFLHSSCFAAYSRYNYTCPLCNKSMGDMTVYFQVGVGKCGIGVGYIAS